jgi:hypothetical protein
LTFATKLIFLVCLLFPIVLHGQTRKIKKQLFQDVSTLAHDSLEGREMGTKGELIAANYISERYSIIGLSPIDSLESFHQAFTIGQKAHPHDESFSGEQIAGRNIIGWINNNAETSIIVGAHYDHLGWGDQSSLSETRAIHNGADDNASGVAALLLLAKRLKKKKLNHNIIFIAFTGEEKGLLGSHYFMDNFNAESIHCMINMDMIGRLDSLNQLAIYGVGTSPHFIPTIEELNQDRFGLKLDSSGLGPSDHTSFYLNDVPVLHFFTGQHAQYHKPEDDVELINFEGLYSVSTYIESLIRELDKEVKLEFTKTKDKKAGKRKFKVTLGVMPDYLYRGEGLKIDGVKSDRVADHAQLKRGDIVTKIGNIEVKSMNDYMTVLNTYNPGDTVELTYLRDNKKHTVEITF